MTGQSRRLSLIESITQMVVGPILAQAILFLVYGITYANLLVGLIMFFVSLIRSYAIRRLFARLVPPGR